MKKFLCAVLIVFVIGFIPCGAASADEALANSMAPGTWTANPRYITFGSYNGHALKWRVLEVYGDKTEFLVLDDVLRNPAPEGGGAVTIPFDYGADASIFPDSTIKNWLNGTFLDVAFTANEQDAILETDYGPDNAHYANEYTWTGGRSKVFLLSVEETMNPKYFNINFKDGFDGYLHNADRAMSNDDDTSGYYWLRSPGYGVYSAAVVETGGSVLYYGGDVYNPYAVRPAVKIDLSSPVFTSANTDGKKSNLSAISPAVPGNKIKLCRPQQWPLTRWRSQGRQIFTCV